ncbi:unnamed protein product [Lymnaea stagnalis]|uniref:DUF4430 domain-containing protein n=1 Tax=Lymnaea stagnalis TaxID=6523 RepID=A0AAV2I1A1_LYMST
MSYSSNLHLVVVLAMFMSSVSAVGDPTVTHCYENGQFPCGLCGLPINLTIIARNQLREPHFELKATLVNRQQRQLLFMVEDAARIVDGFNRFKATYYAGLGYLIDTIQGITGSIVEKTFWHMISINSTVGSFKCGASDYVPNNGETIMFNFTTYSQAGLDF